MNQNNSKKKQPISITCKAVSVFKKNGTDFLSVAQEIVIEDGVVVSVRILNPADLPATSIGRASATLWENYRTQGIE
jgi:hypothetical protein